MSEVVETEEAEIYIISVRNELYGSYTLAGAVRYACRGSTQSDLFADYECPNGQVLISRQAR